MGAKLDQAGDPVFWNTTGAEVAELVTIWQRLSPSERRLLLEQFRKAAGADRVADHKVELAMERHN